MTQDSQMVPPPLPPEYRQPTSYGNKILLMCGICGILMLGVLAVWIMSDSRESSNKNVTYNITSKWGKSVTIEGPIVTTDADSAVFQRPVQFNCNVSVESMSLHRGIYEAEVFNSKVTMNGAFDRECLKQHGDTVTIELFVNTKQIENLGRLKIGTKDFSWKRSESRLYAEVDIADIPQDIDFHTDFDIRGSGGIFIKQIGETTTITIDGEASNPSFNGDDLPIARSITRDGHFYAKWEIATSDEIGINDGKGFAGTNFLVGVDRYQKVERSMKYSFIIILLTFISVLVVEIMKKRPIPLLNYFLIGAALIIFYTLLLSFVELLPFGLAYLIASTMTVALITGYMWRMLQSRNLGLSIGVVLGLMYLFCYILLCISTYALLLGSLLLFFSLAAMMYASLKIQRV